MPNISRTLGPTLGVIGLGCIAAIAVGVVLGVIVIAPPPSTPVAAANNDAASAIEPWPEGDDFVNEPDRVYDLPDDPDMLKLALEDALYRAMDAEYERDELLDELEFTRLRLDAAEADAAALASAIEPDGDAANADAGVDVGEDDLPDPVEPIGPLTDDELQAQLQTILDEFIRRRAQAAEGERPQLRDLVGELWQLQEQAVDPLLAMVGDTALTTAERQTALEMLNLTKRGLTSEDAAIAIENGLLNLLRDPYTEPQLKTAAIRSLRPEKGKEASVPVQDEFAYLLRNDPNVGVRRNAARELGNHAATATSLGALADALLTDADANVRRFSANSLSRIGTPSEIPALERASTQDEDNKVRGAAQQAINKINQRSN